MYFNDGTTMFFIDPSPQPTNSVFRTELLLCPVGWHKNSFQVVYNSGGKAYTYAKHTL